ncbi:hypothetical protein KIP88_45445 [Bradyrhizobium sp. SRL28]|uniref:hypothetical protein n=1 Tax=Bradyrhizobium sp. SRL28 TaxID=2836178 RepID=UPI001BDEB8F0|nr:hypothetical protein [Bradyrhizobium sp. SRL28]MBT1517528.1 hypothetical protein [Bradyrhizobium sp. SRL28]
MDIIIVGDSIGSVCLGIDDTCRSAGLIVQNQTTRCKRLKYLPYLVGTKMAGTRIGDGNRCLFRNRNRSQRYLTFNPFDARLVTRFFISRIKLGHWIKYGFVDLDVCGSVSHRAPIGPGRAGDELTCLPWLITRGWRDETS